MGALGSAKWRPDRLGETASWGSRTEHIPGVSFVVEWVKPRTGHPPLTLERLPWEQQVVAPVLGSLPPKVKTLMAGFLAPALAAVRIWAHGRFSFSSPFPPVITAFQINYRGESHLEEVSGPSVDC